MEALGTPRPEGWTVRRAELVDVPAVARLLGAPVPETMPGGFGLSDQMLTSATRLGLTHVALELGEFWVAVDRRNRVLAAVVLLPPGRKGMHVMDVALRLELGLLPNTLPEPVAMAGIPEEYWLVLPAATSAGEQALRDAIDAALPAIDADGRAVLSLQSGPAQQVLFEVGFRALPETVLTGTASLRPGLHHPVGV